MGLAPRRCLCNHKGGEFFRMNLGRRRRRAFRMKVEKLQRIVPGGHGLQPDSLFDQTANYILHLRLQVYVLESILGLHEPWLLYLKIWSISFYRLKKYFSCILMFLFLIYLKFQYCCCIDQDGSSLLFYWCNISSFLWRMHGTLIVASVVSLFDGEKLISICTTSSSSFSFLPMNVIILLST